MKLIVEGFKTTEDNSIYYKKAIFGEDISPEVRRAFFGKYLDEANKKGADFVSIRFVRDEKL